MTAQPMSAWNPLPETAGGSNDACNLRAIAFYLPQYHPIPENDAWWGTGFTEWTNVARAKRLFSWHVQPHLPADLGFYDLRLAEVREQQASLASEYGISGFCYYHYWFHGKRLLERPFDEVLQSGRPDFPFCLCWANENWTRAWDGSERQILMPQQYSEDDDRLHIRWLCRAFEDPRYVRVDGKPIFLVYRATKLPSPKRTAEIWRDEARRSGVGEILLCNIQSFRSEFLDPRSLDFDASVEFQPRWDRLGSPLFRGRLARLGRRAKLINPNYSEARVYPYDRLVERMLTEPAVDYSRFPCVTPMWDNSARRRVQPVILRGSTPELYQRWLSAKAAGQEARQGLVFINAWNEWGEGNHLEPCQHWGRAYLEATRRGLAGLNDIATPDVHSVPPAAVVP